MSSENQTLIALKKSGVSNGLRIHENYFDGDFYEDDDASTFNRKYQRQERKLR